MAQCNQTPHEFVKNAFTPQIAVMSSPQAERACQKNLLTCVELLQPFSRLNSDFNYKDAGGVVITVKNLKLSFLNIHGKPPHTSVARKFLNASVGDCQEPKYNTTTVGDFKLDTPSYTPWFEAWRDTFLKVQYPSDHEYTNHFLACFLVISSSDNKPAETMASMHQTFNHIINNPQGSLPKWFNSYKVLKYFVIIHDNIEGNIHVAKEAYQSIKMSYGVANTFLLKINSREPNAVSNSPDPWAQFLQDSFTSVMDVKLNEGMQHSASSNSLEMGQEANENKDDVNYHPLSPTNEELALVGNDLDKDIHPRKPTLAQKHGQCLTVDDMEQIRQMLYEFCRSSLFPYVERQIQQLHDSVANKKGVSRSLLSATKRWFNPNKPGSNVVSTSHLVYAPDSPELHIRKLGDLYFLFSNYSGAFQAYHNAKRDYNADQAWLYFAGAVEMASLSAFMANESNRKTCDYMEQSITTYLNTCKLPQFATRATILSFECLKHKSLYGEAAHQLIRMTSEDSDLRSALLLEQAAYCFLHTRMLRKYAFHMVLAGHRFSKSAQRRHALRCYRQAYQVYKDSSWDLSEDHIHYTIGRLSNNLAMYQHAVDYFGRLLKGDSRQGPEQQAVFLKEYMMILDNKSKSLGNEKAEQELPELPVPTFNASSIKILVYPSPLLTTPGKIPAKGVGFKDDPESEEEARWRKLEEILIHRVKGAPPLIMKPSINLYTRREIIKASISAIYQEPIQFSITVVNNLQIPLYLSNVHLLWSCEINVPVELPEHKNLERFVNTQVIKSVVIPERSEQNVILTLTPLAVGCITVKGVAYSLASSGMAESVYVSGMQLFGDINEAAGKADMKGNCIEMREVLIQILPPAPSLQVSFSEINTELLCDEVVKVTVYLQNLGSVALSNVYLGTTVPHLVSGFEFNKESDTGLSLEPGEEDTPAMRDKLGQRNHTARIELPRNRLLPNESHSITLWLKAPGKKGAAVIDLLFYYESLFKGATPSYRLVRHSWNLLILDSLESEVLARSSFNSKLNEQLTLSITMTNLNKAHFSFLSEVCLESIGLFSKQWMLFDKALVPQDIFLNAQESAHFFLKAGKKDTHEVSYTSVNLSSINELNKDFKEAFLAFARKTEQNRINLFDDTHTPENYVQGNLDIQKTNENKEGVLFLQWHVIISDTKKKRLAFGQTQIPMEIIRRKKDPLDIFEDTWMLTDFSNLPNESFKKKREEQQLIALQNQVTYNLEYPAVVAHNFNKEKLCVVPIFLYIHSIVNDQPITCIVDTLEPTKVMTHLDSDLVCPNASSNFCWVCCGKLIRTIKPMSTIQVQLTAALMAPGTYDLGAHVRVSCTRNEPPDRLATHQACTIYAGLIVVNCDD